MSFHRIKGASKINCDRKRSEAILPFKIIFLEIEKSGYKASNTF